MSKKENANCAMMKLLEPTITRSILFIYLLTMSQHDLC